MYAVVGCGECDALWVVSGRPETTGCPRCGKRHTFDRLKRFVETEDEDVARQARAKLLAERSGHGEAFAELDSFDALAGRLSDVGVTDEEYLAGSGLDVEEVAAAGERAARGLGTGTGSRREVIEAALRERDAPTEDEVVDYAAEHGVPAEAARRLLDGLVRAGEASENRGHFRLL